MSALSPQALTLIMLGSLLVLVFSGFPIGYIIGGIALLVGILVWGVDVGQLFYIRMYGYATGYIILALPLFVFMGVMLEHSGITEKMYDTLYLWLGSFRGGLAVVTVLLGTILAACVGVIAASVTMLSLVALPSMLKHGYSKSLATGATVAGGCLGIVIPPSIMLVVYGPMAGVSVGKLFAGAVVPGLIMSSLYITYISIRSHFQPALAPVVPAGELKVSWAKKAKMLVTSTLPVLVLLVSVLGVIFLGIAPPTEAAGVGAFMSIVLVIAYRRFSFKVLGKVGLTTLRVCGYCCLIMAMAGAFTSVFLGVGGKDIVVNFLLSVPGGRWGSFTAIMLILLVLGMFINWLGIVFLMVPIISPLAAQLGFDPLWFGIMVCVNLHMAFMTPPVAGAIFICKGICTPEMGVSMADIIRGVWPFVLLVVTALALCIAFPDLITWLPSKMIG